MADRGGDIRCDACNAWNGPKARHCDVCFAWLTRPGASGGGYGTIAALLVATALLGLGVLYVKGHLGVDIQDWWRESKSQTSDILEQSDFEVELGGYQEQHGIYYVTGTLQNTSTDRAYAHIVISIHMLDETGAIVGDAIDAMSNLKPGGRWKFRAVIPDVEGTHGVGDWTVTGI